MRHPVAGSNASTTRHSFDPDSQIVAAEDVHLLVSEISVLFQQPKKYVIYELLMVAFLKQRYQIRREG